MAIQTTDLLVLQDPTDSQFYKLKVGDLGAYFEETAVTSIQTQSPLNTDNDPESPTISIDEANTTRTGVVARLAQASDVITSNASPSQTAVVTSDLLHSTNSVVGTHTTDIITLQSNLGDLQSDVNTLQAGIDGGTYAT